MAGTKTDSTGVTFPDATAQTTARTASNTVTSFNGSVGAVTGVSSAVAGNGITVSGATGAVTINLDTYNGSASNNGSYPVGTSILLAGNSSTPINSTVVPSVITSAGAYQFNPGAGAGVNLAGTWRCRGNYSEAVLAGYIGLLTRTA